VKQESTLERASHSLSGDAIVRNSRVTGFIGFLVLASCTVSLPSNLRAQEKSMIAIMPLPAQVMQGDGEFLIDGGFGIALKGYKDARLERAQQRFLDTLSRETGIPLPREANFGTECRGPAIRRG
jgi:hexosaminidase